jgi:hypothetical protein
MLVAACAGSGAGGVPDASTNPVADAASSVGGHSGNGASGGGGGSAARDAGATSPPDGFPSVIPQDEHSAHCNDLQRIDSYVTLDKQPTAKAPPVDSFTGGALQDGTYEMVASRVFVDGNDATTQYVVSRTLRIFDGVTKLILAQVKSPPALAQRLNLALSRVWMNRIEATVVCGGPTDVNEYAYDTTPAGALRMARLGRDDGKVQLIFEYRRVGN